MQVFKAKIASFNYLCLKLIVDVIKMWNCWFAERW